MKVIKIRNLIINEGNVRVAISITQTSFENILKEARELVDANDLEKSIDIVELRVDYFEDVFDKEKLKFLLINLRNILHDLPIIFTFRSKNEGGQKNISKTDYLNIYKFVIESKLVDLIDVEFFMGNEVLEEIIKYSRKYNIKTIISNHDFEKTPSKEIILDRLKKMNDLDCDILKIALMPKNKLDVLELLSASISIRNYTYKPLIVISMGDLGVMSRVFSEMFNSCITFASLKNSSAPGQLNVKYLNQILNLINKN